jgi:hypothetical protein
MLKLLKTAALLGLGLAFLTGATAMADEGASKKVYVLVDGTTHDTPGAMFQYLRTRDNGLATGNPKDIVEAYPDEFENVGDLIDQKREVEAE